MVVAALQRDLSRLISGEVLTDLVSREVYASAACLYRVVPMAVVRPANAEEAAVVVEFAAERGIPVTPRGGGTAVAGQTLGEGIVIDLAAHLNRIIAVDAHKLTATVGPGVILGDLNRQLAGQGLMFPPDPSSGDYATIGGMIANNSSGSHSLKYKDTRNWAARLKCVLADGSVTWLEKKPVMPEKTAFESGIFENRIYGGLPPLLHKYTEALERERPVVEKNSAGYHVWDLLHDRLLNPVPLVVGSEGTLALVIKAELDLAPLPRERRAVLIAFSSLEQAVDAVMEIRELSPAAIEIMDHMFLSTVREHRSDLRELLPEDARAILLVEFEADSKDQTAERIERAGKTMRQEDRGVLLYKAAANEAESRLLWTVRKAASPILYRMPGKRLTRFVEDVVVPPEKLAAGIKGIREILQKHGTEAPVLGHAGSGNLHLNPRLDLTDPRDRKKLKNIANDIYDLVIGLHGSITGEHGDGILRAPYIKKQFPSLYPLFKEIKNIFDPEGILNPGKILSDEDEIPDSPLKHKGVPQDITPGALHQEQVMEMLLRCHGCGLCRTYCPVADCISDEKALPRSKISLLRAVAQAELDPQDPAVRAGLDKVFSLCTACQRCLPGCPTGIETARLIQAFYEDHPEALGLRDRLISGTPSVLPVMAKAPGLFSAFLANPAARYAIEKSAGILKDAPLPSPSPDTLACREKQKSDATGPCVAYFPGCLGRYADREGETDSAVALLNALGFEVEMADLPCCGEPLVLSNELGKARAQARKFTSEAQRYLAKDMPLVSSCPACALTVRYQYLWLIGEDAGDLPEHFVELFKFVFDNAGRQRLSEVFQRPFEDKVVNFRSCHYAALSDTDHIGRVLEAVPGLGVETVEEVCCGLAGTYGIKVENREVSEGLAKALEDKLRKADVSLVISGCPLCRLQIEKLGHRVMGASSFLCRNLV